MVDVVSLNPWDIGVSVWRLVWARHCHAAATVAVSISLCTNAGFCDKGKSGCHSVCLFIVVPPSAIVLVLGPMALNMYILFHFQVLMDCYMKFCTAQTCCMLQFLNRHTSVLRDGRWDTACLMAWDLLPVNLGWLISLHTLFSCWRLLPLENNAASPPTTLNWCGCWQLTCLPSARAMRFNGTQDNVLPWCLLKYAAELRNECATWHVWRPVLPQYA
jgi:hypothetical protein